MANKRLDSPGYPPFPSFQIGDFSINMDVYVKYLIGWKIYYNNNKFDDILERQEKARRNTSLYSFLQWLYGNYSDNHILTINDLSFPLAVFPASKDEITDLKSIINLSSEIRNYSIDNKLNDAGNSLVKSLKKWGGEIRDDVTYRMIDFSFNNGLQMNTGQGTYFDMIKSCDIVEHEILNEMGEKVLVSESDFINFYKKLKHRRYIHLWGNPLKESFGRSMAIAISTPIIYLDQNGHYKLIIKKRSDQVAVHKNLFHVIPSAMFQPIFEGWLEEEHDIRHNFKKEYLEELLNKKELTNLDALKQDDASPNDHTFFYNNDNLRYIEYLEEIGDARLLFTGVSFNLLNLRPEICTLLLITNPEWFTNQNQGKTTKKFKLDRLNINWEFVLEMDVNFNTDLLKPIELGENLIFPKKLFKPENFVPPAAGAIHLALKVAREELDIGN